MKNAIIQWGCLLAICVALFLGSAPTFAAAGKETPSQEPGMSPAVIAPDLPTDEPLRNDLDQYGGWTGLKGQKTGFFHVEKLGNRWWFITPEGNAYFMLEMGWAEKKEDVPRLKSWGFNASEDGTGMPYSVNVNFFRIDGIPEYPVSRLAGLPPWVSFPDIFVPDWPEKCAAKAKEVLEPVKDDPNLIGYYLVNEMCLDGWYEAVLYTEKDSAARAAFLQVAREYYANKPDEVAKDWKDYGITTVDEIANLEGKAPKIPALKGTWVAVMAERAYGVASNAAKAVDPNHLNLGTRMINAPLPEIGILKAMGKYCDVVSMNLYSMLPDRLLTQIFTLVPAINMFTGRPTMTTEFSYRGGDTLHPNTMGALPTVKTQAERGVGYLSYVAALASLPSHIGVAWYKYPDDDLEKKWNEYAEDCNFGVMDPQRRPYAVLTETMRATNAQVYELASDPVKNEQIPLFYRTELARWDLPLDEVLIGRLARSNQPFVDPLAQQLPEPRRYHAEYWIRHKGPNLVINDDRFVGWCQANMIQTEPDAQTVTMINIQAFTTFPRSLWLGTACERPDDPFVLESNAQFLSRKVASDGRLLRLTMADGSYLRTEWEQSELRVNCRIPYLDLRFDHDAKTLAVTIRGKANHLGIAGIKDWKITCNGKPLTAEKIANADNDPLTVLTLE